MDGQRSLTPVARIKRMIEHVKAFDSQRLLPIFFFLAASVLVAVHHPLLGFFLILLVPARFLYRLRAFFPSAL
jgi:hypothetical protein